MTVTFQGSFSVTGYPLLPAPQRKSTCLFLRRNSTPKQHQPLPCPSEAFALFSDQVLGVQLPWYRPWRQSTLVLVSRLFNFHEAHGSCCCLSFEQEQYVMLKNRWAANPEAALTDHICEGRFSLSLCPTLLKSPSSSGIRWSFKAALGTLKGNPNKKNVLPWFTMHQAVTLITGSPESSFEVYVSQQTDSKAQYAVTRHSRAASLFLLWHVSSPCLQYISFISPSGSVKASYTLLICSSGPFILEKLN